jgi:3-deoxy-D-manno-octulosonic-acid transferase
MLRVKRSILRGLYSALLTLLIPFALIRLWRRGRKQPAYREAWAERFGVYRTKAPGPLIWIHAVSVGETYAAQPLIRALQGKYPNRRILLSHMTPTGREAGRALFGESVTQCYLPYDLPRAVRAFLRHYRPLMGVLMETEIWFNLSAACHRESIPLFLVNARLSERSAQRYTRARALTAEALQNYAGIAAQSEDDAQRLLSLGARAVAVVGNMKFDGVNPSDVLELGRAMRVRFGDSRPVLLAASTRDGEEEIVLDALVGLPEVLCVIVPRHPQRFDAVADLLARRQVPFQRRSADENISTATRVVLGDSMGELSAYYAACDIAFVGGSLLPFGGQNLIEACALGRPVLIGPHTFNFSAAAELAVKAGAAIRIHNAAELGARVGELLADFGRARQMGEAGVRFCLAHRGATERTLQLLAQAMPD